MQKKRYLIIGIGVLGETLAKQLAKLHQEVIALDSSTETIEHIKDHVSMAVVGDATDQDTLKNVGCTSVDVAVVCIGENFESAVLAVANLMDLKVKHVAARANSRITEFVLRRLGAKTIVSVEATLGLVLANQLMEIES